MLCRMVKPGRNVKAYGNRLTDLKGSITVVKYPAINDTGTKDF